MQKRDALARFILSFDTYHRKDLHTCKDGVQSNLLVAMTEITIVDENIGQTTQTRIIWTIWLDCLV